MSHIYISHAPEDLDALLQVHEALRREGIPDAYASEAEMKQPGSAETDEKISEALALIVILSQDSIRSSRIRSEIALGRARGIPIIPYRIDKARLGGFFKTHLKSIEPIHANDDQGLVALLKATAAAYKRFCPVVAVMNMKGGVGKTTITAQLFGALQAQTGGRVLLIDLDPQYNLSQHFFDIDAVDSSAAEDRSAISLFEISKLNGSRSKSPAEYWMELSTEPFNPPPRGTLAHRLLASSELPGRLDLISGQFEISKYSFSTDAAALEKVRANFLRLIEHYRSVYDLIVFDTNPSATFLNQCALYAADTVLAPMHPDKFSLRGVRLLSQIMRDHVPETHRPDLRILFNGVKRSEQTNFEADSRNGALDKLAGFELSKALMEQAIPQSRHLAAKDFPADATPWERLIIHKGSGGGLRPLRTALKTAALDISTTLRAASA